MKLIDIKQEIYAEGIIDQALKSVLNLAKKAKEKFVQLFSTQFWKGMFGDQDTFEVSVSIPSSDKLREATGAFVPNIPHITEGIAAISFIEAWNGSSGYPKFLRSMVRLREEVKTKKRKDGIEESKQTITSRNLLEDYLKFNVGDVEVDLSKISQGKIINEVQNQKEENGLRRAMNRNHAICLENSRKIVSTIDSQWRSVTFKPKKFFPNDVDADEDDASASSVTFKTDNPNVVASQWPTWYKNMQTMFPQAKEEIQKGIKILKDQQEWDKEHKDEIEWPNNVPMGWISKQVHEVEGYTDHLERLAKIFSDAGEKEKNKLVNWFMKEMFGKEGAVYSSLTGRKVYHKKMIDKIFDKVEIKDIKAELRGTQIVFDVPYEGEYYPMIRIAIDRSNVLVKTTRELPSLLRRVIKDEMTQLKDISGETKPKPFRTKDTNKRIRDNVKDFFKRLHKRKKSVKLVRVFAAGVSPGVKGDFVVVFKKVKSEN